MSDDTKPFPTIDPEPIRMALDACETTGLRARIAKRAPHPQDDQAQATCIARLLDEGDLDGLASLLNKPLHATIELAVDDKALDDLADLIRTLVRSCAAHGPISDPAAQWNPGTWHRLRSEPKSWPVVALVDASCGLDGMRYIQPLPGNEPLLDDASIRAVRLGRVTQTSVEDRLYELVCAFADLVAFDGDKPTPGDTPAVADFCSRVNLMLWNLNSSDKHVFGLWQQASCEPDEVRQRLLHRLPDLRLFNCSEADCSSSMLRVDGDKLETWLASHLKAIDERRKTLAATSAQVTRSARTRTEQEPIPESFDCLLSHNSRDKPAVRALAQALRDRGLSVWLDEEQLRPGIPWQPLLESAIRVSRSVAVLVGADGLGPWETEEMRAVLTLAVRDGRPVIPVLLPDAPAAPELPLFLNGRTWVDMRSPDDPGNPHAALDKLIWGITGNPPERTKRPTRTVV